MFQGVHFGGQRYVPGEILVYGSIVRPVLFLLDENAEATTLNSDDLRALEVTLRDHPLRSEPVETDLGLVIPHEGVAWIKLGIDSPRVWLYVVRAALLPPLSASEHFESRVGRDILDRVVLEVEPDGEFMIIADEDRCLHVRPNTDREE